MNWSRWMIIILSLIKVIDFPKNPLRTDYFQILQLTVLSLRIFTPLRSLSPFRPKQSNPSSNCRPVAPLRSLHLKLRARRPFRVCLGRARSCRPGCTCSSAQRQRRADVSAALPPPLRRRVIRGTMKCASFQRDSLYCCLYVGFWAGFSDFVTAMVAVVCVGPWDAKKQGFWNTYTGWVFFVASMMILQTNREWRKIFVLWAQPITIQSKQIFRFAIYCIQMKMVSQVLNTSFQMQYKKSPWKIHSILFSVKVSFLHFSQRRWTLL